jgi:uncharacterized protein (TIGR02996 family)
VILVANRPPVIPLRPGLLAFLNDCKEHPDDDTPRLVLADWLEEQGDARGEFVRLQCLRARAEGDSFSSREPTGREGELLAVHRQRWLGILTERGVRTQMRRGLVTVSGSRRKLLSKRLALLSEYEPFAWVDDLSLWDFRSEDLKPLVESPHWGRLTELDLGSHVYYADQTMDPALFGRGRGDWSRLASVAALPWLTRLDIRCQDMGAKGAKVLAALPDVERLRILDLACNNLGNEGAAALASSRSLTGLTDLDLAQNRLRADGFVSLANWKGLATVTSLSLRGNYPGEEGAAALVASPFLGNLVQLRLSTDQHSLSASFAPSPIGPRGAVALATSRGLTQLKRLYLSGNHIGPEGAEALAACKAFPNLEELDLSENELGDAGVIALARSPLLQNLTRLDLRYNEIGDAGAEALVNSPYLAKLTHLNYRANWHTTPQKRFLLAARFSGMVELG